MGSKAWQLQTPLSAVVFDCDGTLSALEGINELARNKGMYMEVENLTEKAMGKTGMNPQLYQARLDLVLPNKTELEALGEAYFANTVPDALAVIRTLKRLEKSIYIISAGLNPAVAIFGRHLTIPEENIFAVNVEFDQAGHFLDYERTNPLTTRDGKRLIVTKLNTLYPAIAHIGDGLNDFVTHDIVTRFIGYGGVYYRENLEKRCTYYIRTPSLAPLLPLCLTEQECKKLTVLEQALYLKGLNTLD